MSLQDPSQVANAVRVRNTVGANLLQTADRVLPDISPKTIQLTSEVALRNKSQSLSTFLNCGVQAK